MKRLVIFIGVCMLAIVAMAQQLDARGLLDKASANLRANEGIQARFQIYTPQGETNASISLEADSFFLETPGVKTWFDGTTQWTYLEENQEVSVTNPTPEELQQINPYVLLNTYQSGYDLLLVANNQAKMFHEIRLTAQSEEQPLQRITLMLNKKTLHPIRIKMKPQGMAEEVDVVVTEYHTKKQFADDFFRFNPASYPQAEVIDLR